ncbi:hypothetical protein MJM99_30680, partial [Salmonella enterica subsp. enterica serovar Kentucky]|nr:hypothetical protein [Salmonella enterica subsp. enterica serovar Kentucky]
PALRDADVGISVDSAADIAKESSDIILLEKDLMVLEEGVIKGPSSLEISSVKRPIPPLLDQLISIKTFLLFIIACTVYLLILKME